MRANFYSFLHLTIHSIAFNLVSHFILGNLLNHQTDSFTGFMNYQHRGNLS